MTDQLVGAVPGDVLGALADIMLKLKAGKITSDELKRFAKRENPFSVPTGTFNYDRARPAGRCLKTSRGVSMALSWPCPSYTTAKTASTAK